MPSRRALFLDRDGVINVDHGYVHRQDQFEFMPGIFELARFAMHELGWPIIVVTNQSGIGRGMYDENMYQDLTHWMCERFTAENASLTEVYHCPYHPDFGIGAYRVDHPWRKPKPGMILHAAAELDLDLASSAIIGNSPADMEAAVAAGIGLRIQLASRNAQPGGSPCELVSDLRAALAVLRSKLRAEGS